MAIYRAERAILSFASEAGGGGYFDVITTSTADATWTSLINSTTGTPVGLASGSRSLPFDGVAGGGTLAIGDYILLGTVGDPDSEIRRVASLGSYNGSGASGTIFLDAPTGFFHPDNDPVGRRNATPAATGASFITFLPGVYESVTVPDMTPEFLPQYFLGASNRNWYYNYRGRQTFAGSLPNFIVLNGYPFRFAIGTVRTVASAYIASTTTTTAATRKGARELPITTDVTTIANGDFVEIENSGNSREVRQIISGSTGLIGAQTLVLNYPMMFDHASGVTVREVAASPTYTHTILESVALDSVTWNLRLIDSDSTAANDFIRRYFGGKIGRATLSADEGGMLRFSWDDAQFLGLVNNQTAHSTGNVPFDSLALINPTGVGGDIPHSGGALGTPTYPTTQPYYFSQGTISLFGTEFARVRNFRLEINNNIDPRYYISETGFRGPFEILEQRREYRMSATIALPDSLGATATTRTLFKELLLEGNYTAGFSGFDMTLTFRRGASDTITITIPSSAASNAGESQGAFIVRSPINLGTDSPVQAEVEILFRNMEIAIVDSIAVYP